MTKRLETLLDAYIIMAQAFYRKYQGESGDLYLKAARKLFDVHAEFNAELMAEVEKVKL